MDDEDEKVGQKVFELSSHNGQTEKGLDAAHYDRVSKLLAELISAESDKDSGFLNFDAADENKDGVIDWPEFKRLLIAANQLLGVSSFKKVLGKLNEGMSHRRSSEAKLEDAMMKDMRKVKERDAEAAAHSLLEVSKKTHLAIQEVEGLKDVVENVVVELEQLATANEGAHKGHVTEKQLREVLQKHHESKGVLTDAQIHKVFLMMEAHTKAGIDVPV